MKSKPERNVNQTVLSTIETIASAFALGGDAAAGRSYIARYTSSPPSSLFFGLMARTKKGWHDSHVLEQRARVVPCNLNRARARTLRTFLRMHTHSRCIFALLARSTETSLRERRRSSSCSSTTSLFPSYPSSSSSSFFSRSLRLLRLRPPSSTDRCTADLFISQATRRPPVTAALRARGNLERAGNRMAKET